MIDPDGSNILFIIGGPRSGTTWLHRLIASHPEVCTGQESNLFLFYISPLIRSWDSEEKYFDERGPNGLCCYVTDEQYMKNVSTFASSCLGNLPIDGKKYFLEKTTSHVCSAENIVRTFPKTKIVLIHRHPFEVVPSLIKAGKSWGRGWAPTSVIRAVRMWRRYARCTIRAIQNVSTDHLITLSFDDLRSDPERTLKEIYDFLGLSTTRDDIKYILKQNEPDNPQVLKIPFFGKYMGRYIEEPEGFFRKQDKIQKISIMSKLIIYMIARNEMQKLSYGYR
jgi:Sulfotransferase family